MNALILFALLIISAAISSVAVLMALQEELLPSSTDYLWGFVFAILIALWANNDAKDRGLYKPYEYSFFVFLFWPITLLYHLWKTRRADGLMFYVGLWAIQLAPSLAWLLAWFYYT